MVLPQPILHTTVPSALVLLLSLLYHWNCCLATHNIIHSSVNYRYHLISYLNLVCTNQHSNSITEYSWRYQQDGTGQNDQNALAVFGSDASYKGGITLTLTNMDGSKEGLFWCTDNNEDTVEYFNVTVYGLPQFDGCLSPILQSEHTSCNLGTIYSATVSKAIYLNITFQYHGAGNRGAVEPIKDIRVLKSDGIPLFYCTKGKNCVGVLEAGPRINFTYTDRYDIQVTLTDASFNDSGKYTALAKFTHSTLTSYLTINVTSSISSSPTSSIFSSFMYTPTSLATSSTVSSTFSHSTITSSHTISSHTVTMATTSLTTVTFPSRQTPSSITTPHPTSLSTTVGTISSPAATYTQSNAYVNSINSPYSSNTGSPGTKLTVIVVVGCISALVIISVFVLTLICVLKSKTEFTSLTKLFPVKDRYDTAHMFSDKNSVTNKSYSIRVDNEPVYEQPQNVNMLSHEYNSKQVFV